MEHYPILVCTVQSLPYTNRMLTWVVVLLYVTVWCIRTEFLADDSVMGQGFSPLTAPTAMRAYCHAPFRRLPIIILGILFLNG